METNANRWLRLAYKWLMPVALVAAIGVAAVTVISAGFDGRHAEREVQRFFGSGDGSDQGDQEKDCDGRGGHGKFGANVEELAALLGTDVDGLKAALAEGQTLAAIAEANGVEVQTVIDALVERVNERIDAAVEAGKLTEEEAASKRSEAAAKVEERVNNGHDGERSRGWGKRHWRGHGGGAKDSVETNAAN